MASRTASKKALSGVNELRCTVHGMRTAFSPQRAIYDPADKPLWTVEGPLGERPLSPRMLDLLDLVGGIYRLESQITSRPTNPAKDWQIEAPVREPHFWAAEGGAHLNSVLSFLNRARWTFQFRRGKQLKAPAYIADGARKVQDIVLFSGGMDSACGAGIHRGRNHSQLVSFYGNHKQRALQQQLAQELGFLPPVQWRLHGRRGKEGMNLIRAFMFLTLGAFVAETFGAKSVFQYENGVLAMAIPQAGISVPTRHAHPELYLRLHLLWESVFERSIVIENPFGLMTKREQVHVLIQKLGDKANGLLDRTETCWRLPHPHVGGEPKAPGQPCGVCIPCIVRLTARPDEFAKKKGRQEYRFDLRTKHIREHPKLGLSFRNYLELLRIVLGSVDDFELVEQLAPEARALIGGPAGPSVTEAASILRRFGDEFCDTFDIPT